MVVTEVMVGMVVTLMEEKAKVFSKATLATVSVVNSTQTVVCTDAKKATVP
jgi:hypothetical protein